MDAHRLPDGDEHNPEWSPESQLMGFPIQSNPKATRRADPSRYVTADAPPIWISHGSADPAVPYNQSQLLFAAYTAARVEATYTLVQDAGHTDDYLTGWDPEPSVVVHTTRRGKVTRTKGPVPDYDHLRTFLDRHLRG